MTDTGFQVDFFASPESLARLEGAIANAVGKAFTDKVNLGAAGLATERVMKKIASSTDGATAASKKEAAAAREMVAGWSSLERAAGAYINQLRQLGNAVGAISAASNRVRTNERQEGIQRREGLLAEQRERLAITERETKQLAQEARTSGELQVNAAKVAGKQRVQITRAVLETIGRLEKGIGATLAGLARTSASAVSKVFTSLTSTMRRSNSTFTEGLNSSLRTRESTINNSFSRQERELRSSVLRQERQLTELRTISSRGVLGAVTGRGVGVGLAGLGGGIALASLLGSGYQDAVNFGEQLNKNKVVFGEFTDAVLAFASNAPRALGVTKAAALESTGTFGNLFSSLGLANGQSAMLSVSLTQIATDLSSFNNTPVDEAFLALRSGLVGESEPLRKFGIDVSDARLRHEAFLLGISDGKSVLTAAQKAQAAYSAIIKDSTKAQGDFARTADQGANAARVRQASLLQLASSLESKFVPVLTAVNIAVGGLARGIAKFIDGDVSPAMRVLRDALKGVAVGLGTVLAVKGGVEVIRLLAVSLQLALTPMGAALAIAAGLGAAIGALWNHSKGFHDALVGLGRYILFLSDKVFGALKAAVAEVEKTFKPVREAVVGTADALERTARPASRFFQDIANTIKGGLFKAATFLTDTVIPAVVKGVIFIGKEVIPRIGPAVDFVASRAKDIAASIGELIAKIRPYVQPAIDGFMSLGRAIGGALGGDFTGLRSGAASALSGIGTTVAKIAGRIGEALLPVARQVLLFFTELFSGPNLAKYAKAFLGFVEGVGRVIGSIVSSPIFIKAVAGLAAAAVIIGAKFLQGFAEGVLHNIPAVFSMLGDAIGAGLSAAIGNPATTLKIVLAAFALGPLATQLVRRFRGVGEQAGTSLSSGFTSKIRDGKGFLSTFFGGASSGDRAAIGRLFNDATKEAQGLQNKLRALGSSTQVLVSPTSIKNAKAELKKLESGLSQSELAGLRWRDTLKTTVAGVSGIFGGLKGAVGGIGQALLAPFKALGDSKILTAASNNFSSFLSSSIGNPKAYVTAGTSGARGYIDSLKASLAASGATISQGFSTAWSALKTMAKEQGRSVGGIIGSAVGSAAAIGLSAFVGGKAEGAAGGNGLFGALTAGVTGFALTGNPIIGAAAAGISFLGTKIGQAGAEAKRFKEEVKQVGEALRSDLTQAVKDGTVSLDKLKAGLIGISDVSGLDAFQQTVVKALGTDGIAALDKFGLTWEADLKPIFESGGDLDVIKQKMRDTFFSAAGSSDEFAARFGKNADKVAQVLADIARPGGVSTIDEWVDASAAGFDTVEGRFASAIKAQADYLQGVLDTSGDLTKAANETKAALDGINSSARVFGTGIDASPLTRVFDTVDRRVRETTGLFSDAIALRDALFAPGSDAAIAQARGISQAASLGQSDQAIRTSGDKQSIIDANDLINRDDLRKVIVTALSEAPAGTIVDDASARAYVQPIIDAYVAGITDPTAAAMVKADLEKNLPVLFPAFDNVRTAEAAKREAETISAYMQENFPEVKLDNVSFDTEKALYQAGLTAADVQAFVDKHPALAKVTFDQQAAAAVGASIAAAQGEGYAASQHPIIPTMSFFERAAARAKGINLGSNIATGTKDGVDAGAPAVRSAIEKMIQDGVNAAKKLAKIFSPSRVFRDIGQRLGEGLALGITDTSADVTGAVSKIVEQAIAEATQSVAGVSSPMAAAAAALFGSLTGSKAALNTGAPLLDAQIGVTTAVQSLLTTLTSNAQTVWDVNAKKAKDLTLADRNILGESAFSLNANDVIGASNLQALTGAFDAISQLGSTLLGQGQDAATVAATLQRQVDDLINTATNAGFDRAQVLALADALGLSSDALAAFIQQLGDLQAATPTDTPHALPRVEQLHIHAPTRDPEATALQVMNALVKFV